MDLQPMIRQLEGRRVLVVGDLMIDEYVWGSVDRISPEAPVPVVAVQRENATLGGAGNVVSNIAALGGRVWAAGLVGADSGGERMLAMFGRRGADASGVLVEAGRPTTRKTRIIAAHQHVLRIDREIRRDVTEDSFEKLSRFAAGIIPDMDCVLVSDYGKGVITRDFFTGIAKLARDHGKPLIVDPKGTDFSKYAGATLLTPNRKEAAAAAGIAIPDDPSLNRTADRIMRQARLDRLLVTCGPDGMVLFERGEAPYPIPSEARQVFDVSGAGDTVLSVLGLAVAAGASFRSAAALANTAAGIVVSKIGAATVSPDELICAVRGASHETGRKIKSPEEMARIVRELKARGLRVVMTNGCFDLLHVGHILLFSESRRLGDILIAAIDDDDSVRKLKGEGRPIIRAGERARIISAIDSVDYVVVFSSDTFETLLTSLQPDILAKGGNYTPDSVRGRRQVEAYGGRIALIPVAEDVSSTELIDIIRKRL